MQSFSSLLLLVIVMGYYNCSSASIIILSIDCSKYVDNLKDTFHPYKLNGSEVDYCKKCLCDETGQKAACNEHKCPELNCDRVVQEKGKCCKSCDTSDQLFLAPDKMITTCKINGSEYEDLSLVPTSNISDPCEVCHCRGGKILCKSIFEACPKPKCDRSQLVWDKNKCCPTCPFDPNQPHKQDDTCKQNGFVYQEGDVWNPYYPSFGVVPCLNCICKSGLMSCAKLPCPPVKDCTEDDPVEDITLCCPKCRRTPSPPPPVNKSEGSGSSTEPPTRIIIELVPEPVSEALCKNMLHKVYESVDSQVDQIAIESTIISRVDVYTWNFSSAVGVQYEAYRSDQFAKNLLATRFKYIGSTTEAYLNKLKRRFNARKKRKNLNYCRVKCASTVIKILKPCNSQTRK